MSSRYKAIIALIIANVVWGAASPIFKWSLTNISPFTLAFLRFSLAAIILFPFVYQKFPQIKREDFFKIFLFGFSGVTLNIAFFFWGLKLAPSINAAVIATLQPLLLLLLGAFFLKENVQLIEVLGTLVSFAGVLIIILFPLLTDGFQAQITLWGNFLLLIATLGAVGQAFFGKQLFRKFSSLPLTFLAFFIGAISFFPLCLYEWWHNPGWLGNLQIPGLVGIIYGVILSSTIAYSLYDWALSQIEASETGIFTYLMPITAILIAVPVFGEKITLPFIIGSIFVILGILLTERRVSYRPLHKAYQN